MNAAFKKLEELGLIDDVKEYAKERGFPEVSVVFEYSSFRCEVIAEVKDAVSGRSAHRIEGLKEFLNTKDQQHDRAHKMLKACVDQMASDHEQWKDNEFFKKFPSLDPNNGVPWKASKSDKPVLHTMLAVNNSGGPLKSGTMVCIDDPPTAKRKATVPPPEAGKRPKRTILD